MMAGRTICLSIFLSLLLNIPTANLFSSLQSIQKILLTSDYQGSEKKDTYWARGNISAVLNDRLSITADRLLYNAKTEKITFYGSTKQPIFITMGEVILFCHSLLFDLKNEQSLLSNLVMRCKKCRLHADRGTLLLDGQGVLYNARFTSCKHKVPHWEFLIDRVRLTTKQKLIVHGVSCQLYLGHNF